MIQPQLLAAKITLISQVTTSKMVNIILKMKLKIVIITLPHTLNDNKKTTEILAQEHSTVERATEKSNSAIANINATITRTFPVLG